MTSQNVPLETPELVNVYRDTQNASAVRALRLRTSGNTTFTITHQTRGRGARWVVTGGYPPDSHVTFWACPGHNGHVCFYGMCDETVYTGPLPGQAAIDAHNAGDVG